jgi:hypothetical protein
MDFREFASKEAADLVARLTKAASTVADQAAKQVADDAQKIAEGLRGELQAAVKQKMGMAATLKEAQAQVEALRADFKNATERGEVASRQLGEARRTNEKLEKERGEIVAARDEQARAKTTAETELRKSREALEAARAETAATAKKLEAAVAMVSKLEDGISVAQSESAAAEAKLTAVTQLLTQSAARVTTLERAQQDHARVVREMEGRLNAMSASAASAAAAPRDAAPAPLASFDDLLAGFQALSGATTIADVLTTLVEQLAAQYPRVALFRVKKSHLQGEHQIGFDLKTDIAKVVMPLGMDSLLSRAASSGSIERLSAEELKDSSRAPFNGSPHAALAIPIVVGGETLGIVYADDAGASRQKRSADADALSARIAEAMQQHAVALLMRMTNELKMRAELQSYARSLLRELEQMYSGDLHAEKPEDELRARLKGNLDYARSIFDSRVALEGGDAAALLDDELAALIDSEQTTPFARDLAVVAGRPELAEGRRSAAEAS